MANIIFISLQLFDKDNHLNKHGSRYLFNTEGHIFPISQKFRRKPWEEEESELKQESLMKEALILDARTNKTFSNVSLPGPGYSKHLKLNELVKRSTR